MNNNSSKSNRLSAIPALLVTAVILGMTAYVRIRLLSVPLERDEGEFAYIGQLLLKGMAPFTNAYTMKLPGVSVMYALFMSVFGQSPAGIHLGLLIVNGVCIWLVYLLAQLTIDRDAAFYSCAAYAVMSLSQSVFGVFAHATHFVVVFVLAGLVLLLRVLETQKRVLLNIFLSGLCFGLAITMKQHAAILASFSFLYLIWNCWKGPASDMLHPVTAAITFLIGMILPYIVIIAAMVYAGVLGNFWFWTVQYAGQYVSEATWLQGVGNFFVTMAMILKRQWPLCFLSGAGCLFVWSRYCDLHNKYFLRGFLVASFLSICPGLHFRHHYYIMMLPAIALMVGIAVNLIKNNRYILAPLVLIAVLLVCVFQERMYFFMFTPMAVSTNTYNTYNREPFPEAIQIARYLKDHTTASDRIVVFGSEPEIYFYADRISATGHIYMFGLMERQPYAEQMQAEMIREIETNRPKYAVDVSAYPSWPALPSSPQLLINWKENYLGKHYVRTGIIDILSPTRYVWGDDALAYSPKSNAYLTVYKRKEE
jgi:hypothetical protein